MSRNRHEDRSDSILRAVSPGTKRDQELSIPRGARRLDVVHRFVRAPERELRAARLLRSLLDHPTLPEDARDQLARDIMSGRTIHVSEAEQDSAWDRAVRQGMELGEQKGMRQGIQQGIQQGVRQGLDRARAALLAAAASHVPDRLPELERIDDIDELARAVAEALATR